MPLPKGTKFAMKKTSNGEIRLAFNKSGKVIEAKNMKTKKVHTPAEFKADAKKASMRKKMDKTPYKTETKKRKMVEKKKGGKS
jgi:hypothetical protein